MWLSHYLSRTEQRLVQLPYGIQVSHGFGRLHGKVDWIKNIDESAVLATAYDPTYRLYTGRKAIRSGFHKPVPSLSISKSKTGRWLGIDSKKNLTELGVGISP